ncbi:hypothetical protein OG874_22500 [Nocardia sp. NBC_00565]|uniref:hypothetical protein n=1 Tax=Nocardia sp. NBC_00565 TaxID=2975993 RepID=UPI002E809FC2|nr:hypothetical protein [Nocardia sp. NBC_00565]WUC07688.1 hypothetical protein OG874_22500 [Nocardia sp. NBC_00565]
MDQSLRVDVDRLRTLALDMSAMADGARQELTTLKAALTAEGECWGNDEPGRTFGEQYEPAAKNGLTGFQNLVDRLQQMSGALSGTAETFENQDLETAAEISDPTPTGFTSEPTSYIPNQPTSIAPSSDQPSTQTQNVTPSASSPTDSTSSPTVSPSSPTASEPIPGVSAIPGAADVPGVPYQPAQSQDQAQSNPGSTVPSTSDQDQSDRAASTENQPIPGTAIPPAAAAAATSDTPAQSPAAGKAAGTPWSRPTTGMPWQQSPTGTPWPRNGSRRPGQVIPPRRADAAPKPDPARGATKPRRSKSEPAQAKRKPVQTDAAALAAARVLAARYGFRIVGFDTSGIGEQTVAELAAAIDDVLGRYPFIALGGIEITELADGAVSRVTWDRPDDDASTAAWILLDRRTVADPARLTEKVSAATRSGQMVAGSGERPMHSTIVHDLGRIVTAAVPRARRLAQRALITEYHRISGPWQRADTLAGVVAGYRVWRAQLSRGCFTDGRWDPGPGLVLGFAEVVVCGARACGPAGVLHRLVVEIARGQSDAGAGAEA